MIVDWYTSVILVIKMVFHADQSEVFLINYTKRHYLQLDLEYESRLKKLTISENKNEVSIFLDFITIVLMGSMV